MVPQQTKNYAFKVDNNVADHLEFYNGTTLVGEIVEDSNFLRLNKKQIPCLYLDTLEQNKLSSVLLKLLHRAEDYMLIIQQF